MVPMHPPFTQVSEATRRQQQQQPSYLQSILAPLPMPGLSSMAATRMQLQGGYGPQAGMVQGGGVMGGAAGGGIEPWEAGQQEFGKFLNQLRARNSQQQVQVQRGGGGGRGRAG